MFIDTHSHLYLGELSHHIPEAIEHLREANFSHAIQIGTSLTSSQTCLDLVDQYPDILRATVGIHPCEAQNMPFENAFHVRETVELFLSQHPEKIVGIGEIGFDEYHLSEDVVVAEVQKYAQTQWFHMQTEIAKKYDLPIVIHARNCPVKTYENICASNIKKFVIHCFSENIDFARSILAYSEEAMISFTGILTYPKSLQIQEVAHTIPLDRIMIETDAPYLVPHPLRGKVPYCEPAYSRLVFEALCELRTESREEIEHTLWQNSVNFFHLGEKKSLDE